MSKKTLDKTIQIVGLGYIGLPTAALLASLGYKVKGLDVNTHVVETINAGEVHIKEPQLDLAVRTAVTSGFLKAYTKPQVADIHVIAVPTPIRRDSTRSIPHPDISSVHAAFRSLLSVLKAGDLVVLESTSPVGTTRGLHTILKAERPELSESVLLAYCPERVLPGKIITELISNDRVVGGLTAVATDEAHDFYKSFVEGQILKTNSSDVAELVKLSENAFRDVNIAFANELSLVCDYLGLNVREVISLANHHPRVKILSPGTGVGGHCIAVDPWFIADACPERTPLIQAARRVNDGKPHWLVDKITEARQKFAGEPRLALFGLTFKPDVDDIRESPAIEVVTELFKKNIPVAAIVEPNLAELPAELKGKVPALSTVSDALSSCDIAVFLVSHSEFRTIPAAALKSMTVIDPVGVTS